MQPQMRVTALLAALVLSTALGGCLFRAETDPYEAMEEIPQLGAVDERECFEHDGQERCWHIHIPETAMYGFCAEHSCPLLMDIHGLGVSIGDQANLSDFTRLTDEEHVIVVHPEGMDSGWNFGWCCTAEDDVGFLLQLIDRIIEERNVDENRVYLTGWSNGCFMSQEMASVASDTVAAVACMAGYADEPLPSDYAPVPVMEIHGLVDPQVLYGSSVTASYQVVGTLEGDEGAIQNLYHWATANGCEGLTPDVETADWDHSIKKFTNCEGDTEAALVTLNYAQHNPYMNDYGEAGGNPTGIDTTQIAWDFLRSFTKNEA